MPQFLSLLAGGMIVGSMAATFAAAGDRPDPARWQETIDAMVANRPAIAGDGTICFIGSSSIRMWDLERWFPNREAVNRGFGGSHIADSTHYAEQLVFPHRPDLLVFYAGDNDIAHDLTPDQVVEDYRAFVEKLRAELPKLQIRYIAIKPSLMRWDKYPAMAEANQKIAKLADADPLTEFIDICPPMLGSDGKPIPNLFREDGLHLSEAGYQVWTDLLKKAL